MEMFSLSIVICFSRLAFSLPRVEIRDEEVFFSAKYFLSNSEYLSLRLNSETSITEPLPSFVTTKRASGKDRLYE